MLRKTIAVLLTVLVMLAPVMLLASCGEKEKKPFTYVYPENFDGSYCYQNYHAADPHLTYLHCAYNAAGTYNNNSAKYTFYAIQDTDIQQYIGCVRLFDMSHYKYYPMVMKADTVTVDPIFDGTVTSAFLYWQNPAVADMTADSEDSALFFQDYGSLLVIPPVTELDADALIRLIRDTLEEDKALKEQPALLNSIQQQDNKAVSLFLRISFAETPRIVWDAQLFATQGHFFIVYKGLRESVRGYIDITSIIQPVMTGTAS